MEINETSIEKKNIKIGVLLSVVAFALSIVINIFFIPHLLEKVGDAQYGLYSFATSITSMLIVLSFGMTSGYVRFATIAEKEKRENGLSRVNGVFVVLLLAASLIALLAGGLIVALFAFNVIPLEGYSEMEKNIILWCLSISVLNVGVNFINYIFSIFINFRMRFVWARIVSMIASILIPLTTSLVIFFFDNIIVFVIIELAVNTLLLVGNFLYSFFVLKYRANPKLDKANKHIMTSVLSFSFFIFLVTLVTELNSNSNKILLGFFADPESVAYYQLGMTFLSYVSLTATVICSTYVPLVNRYVMTGDNSKINKIFLGISKKMIFAYLCFFGGFVAVGKDFVYAWVADTEPRRIIVYYIGCLLMFISMIPSTLNMTSEIQRSQNKHKVRAFTLLAGAVLNVGITALLLVLLPRFVSPADDAFYIYQIACCLVGTLVSTLVFNIIIMSIYNHKVIKLKILSYYKYLLIYSLLSATATMLVFLVYHYIDIASLSSWTRTFIKGFTYLIFFFGMFFAFNRSFVLSLLKTKKGDGEKAPAEPKRKRIITLDDDYVQVAILDVDKLFDNLAAHDKDYVSAFEDPFLTYLKQLNIKYGLCFSLHVSNHVAIKKTSAKWKKEFADNSNWLKFAFRAGRHSPYDFIDASFAKEDYSVFASQILRITSCEDSIDAVISFKEDNASMSAINDLNKVSDFPVAGLLVTKEENVYSLDDETKSSLVRQGTCFDTNTGMVFIKAFSFENLSLPFSAKDGVVFVPESAFFDREDSRVLDASRLDAIFASLGASSKKPDFAMNRLFYSDNRERINQKPKMRVGMINTYNRFSTGSNAKSIIEIAKARGYDCRLFYGRLNDEGDDESVYFGTSKFVNLVNNAFVKLSGRIGGAHYFETKALIKKMNDFNPDIIHVHNIHGNYLNHQMLFDYLLDKNVIMTMHDCFLLTGRCAHFVGVKQTCHGWKKECFKCPYLSFYPASLFFDKAHEMFMMKRRFISEAKNLRLVAISNWEREICVQAGIPENKMLKISNGIDLNSYRGKEKNEEPNKKIRLIGVSTLWAEQKGILEFNYLADNLDSEKYEIILIGRIPKKTRINKKITRLGLLDNEKTVLEIEKSDLFIAPTYVDTFPTVLIESLSVGTPIVAYNVGGCAEIIGDCGVCVEKGDKKRMLQSIVDFDFLSITNSKVRARSLLFAKEKMVAAYLDAYGKLINYE